MNGFEILEMSNDEIELVDGGLLPVVPLIALGVAVVALFGAGVGLGFSMGNAINERSANVKQK